MPKPDQSLVRILNGPKGPPNGGGVLVSSTAIITCDHVIEGAIQDGCVYLDFPLVAPGVTLKANVRNRYPFQRTALLGEPQDLALLRLEPDQSKPEGVAPAEVVTPDTVGPKLQVCMCGFTAGRELGEWGYGQLIGRTGEGWMQLDRDLTSIAARPGFSGTPVFLEADGRMAGLIAMVHERGERVTAFMIPAGLIEQAWPGILREDARAEAEAKKPAALHEDLSQKCDRDAEMERFIQFLRENSGQCMDKPQVFILQGEADACHISLVNRICRSSKFLHWLETDMKLASPAPHLAQVHWPVERDPAIRGNLLREQLFQELFPDYRNEPTPEALAALCKDREMKRHGAVLVAHWISTDECDPFSGSLLTEYLNEFWAKVPCADDLPLFLVFLNVAYSKRAKSLLRRWGCFYRRWRLGRSLRKALAATGSDCLCLQLEELKLLKRAHLQAWFIRNRSKMGIALRVFEQHIEALFGENEWMPMDKVEDSLIEFINRINSEAYHRKEQEFGWK